MKKPVFKKFVLFLLILFLGLGIYAGVRVYRYSSGAGALSDYNAYIEKFKNDTYGGKTPEETLKLFVDALKKGDVELASKYFALDKNGSREKWVQYLNSVKEKNLLQTMAKDIETEARPAGSPLENYFHYKLYSSDGTVAVTISLQFNGQAWKIQRL